MATRVDASDVKLILATELSEEAIEPFLEAASAWVDSNLASSTLGAPLLAQIEKWLAAHFVTALDPRVAKVKAGPVDVTFLSDRSESAPTDYLKTAAALDATGTLAAAFLPTGQASAMAFVGRGFAG